MQLIPAGEFLMGTPKPVKMATDLSDELETRLRESPVHKVWLSAFYLDTYQVSNERYQEFVADTGHKSPPETLNPALKHPTHPVVGISWHDAKAYASWAGKRLPTEAEWEKAARGGLEQQSYPWGNHPNTGKECNSADKHCPCSWKDESINDGFPYTAPVGTFPPNGYGLYDMAGSVWEWCYDDCRRYDDAYVQNPIGPLTFDRRAIRGGSWSGSEFDLRCSRRDQRIMSAFGEALSNVGFRCAANPSALLNSLSTASSPPC